MSIIEYDAAVIGAGVAGLTAGISLVRRGWRVAVVTAGEPTACLSTGCIDVCKGPSPLEAIAGLPAAHPLRKVSTEYLASAHNQFLEIMEKSRLDYRGDILSNRKIVTAIGAEKTTCLVPDTMQASPPNARVPFHLVTFAGLKDFYPSYITAQRPVSVSTYDAGAITTMGIATRFEQDEFLEAFLQWLANQRIREDLIAFPAVLGLESAHRILRAIEQRTERLVFEIPTLPPSIPGRRLFNALKNYFRSQGGEIYWNWPVTGMEKSGASVEALYTASHGRPNSIDARSFILASGSFVGGGLSATRETILEKVFQLPVYMPEKRDAWFENDYFSANHAVSLAGITVDASFRPDQAPLSNVFICGGILAHAQILKYGCGHGLSLATGYAAARACAEMLS